jgi:SAM-dependent methyltransferase
MALRHVQKTYDELGASDPLWAVLSFPEAKGNRWDPEVFFARGRDEIERTVAGLARRGVELRQGRALDFGCGVGRLTQALAMHFETVDGVDISASMIEGARRFNQFGERCRYHVNTVADLALFESGQYDFIYSNITLQHIPPEASERYIVEFVRLLRPGGIALFQVPDGPLIEPGTLAHAWYRLRSGPLRRGWKRLRGKAPVEIHHVNQARVRQLITGAGGTVRDSWQEGSVRRRRVSRFYLVELDDRPKPMPA